MSQDTDRVIFDVEGMTCASCALRIERILSKQDGVDEAVVNFAGQEARAVIQPGTDVAGLQAAIEKIGYEIHPLAPGEERETPVARYAKEVQYQKRNVLLAAAFTLPLMVISMFGPDTQAAKVWQLVLSTPVVFIFGSQFHVTAFKRLRGLDATMDTLISVGSLAAWGYSVWAMFNDQPVYFETAAMIITLILLGPLLRGQGQGQRQPSRHQTARTRRQGSQGAAGRRCRDGGPG